MYPDPNRKRRFGWLDAIILAAVIAAAVYTWFRVSDVLVYKWDWGFLPQVLIRRGESSGWWEPNALLEGFLTTIRLSFWAMLLACLIGVSLGVMATMQRLLPRLVSTAYVGLIRNVPPLVFIFVFYFFISSQVIPALGVDVWARNLSPESKQVMGWILGPPDILENLISGALCLAMFEAAYIAEIVRAGILSVPKSQSEGARSLGLSQSQTFRLVIMPQALRNVTPPLANQFILLIKNSAIVSLISVQELTFIGSEIAISTGRRFETWITVAVMYFILCYALAWMFARMERRMSLRGAR